MIQDKTMIVATKTLGKCYCVQFDYLTQKEISHLSTKRLIYLKVRVQLT